MAARRNPCAVRVMLAALIIFCHAPAARAAAPQQVVDGIAARVENDIILQSEVRELGAFQRLVNGKQESNEQLLDLLIDQWVVRTEAEMAQFPQPADADVAGEIEKLTKSAGSAEQMETRLRQSGLRHSGLLRLIRTQLFLANYLDSRFRAAVQIEPQAIDDFYAQTVVPLAQSRGETPPPLESSRDSIREALVQRGISEQADRWLKESRARLHVEKVTP